MNDNCVTPLTFISNCSKSTKTFKTRSRYVSLAAVLLILRSTFMSFVNFSQFNLRYVELHNYLIFYLQCHVYFNTFCYAIVSLSINLQ